MYLGLGRERGVTRWKNRDNGEIEAAREREEEEKRKGGAKFIETPQQTQRGNKGFGMIP